MRTPYTITQTLAIGALCAIACVVATSCQPGLSTNPQATPAQAAWTGTFAPIGDTHVRGSVAITKSSTRDGLDAFVSITGGTPNTPYGWRIRQGHCEDTNPAVVEKITYPSLVPAADGSANVTTPLTTPLDPKTSYIATISAPNDTTDAASAIACAPLSLGGM